MWRFTHQQAQRVDRLRLALLQRWQARLDSGNLRSCLGDIQVRGDAVSQAQL